MTTKKQKIFAKFIRTKNPHERKSFGKKLKGVNISEVSYTRDGQRYTVHGNIPCSKSGDERRKRKIKRKHAKGTSTASDFSYHTKPGRSRRSRGKEDPLKSSKHKDSDDSYWSGYKRTFTGK